MRYGKVVAYRADHLLTLAWQAEKKKKPVIMLSTTCSAAMTVLTPPSRRPVYKPAVVDCYNHFMNGVDIADQHAVYYSFIRKTVKWWRMIVFLLIETSMVNSYILYKDTVASPKSHVAYHRSVIESLASRHISMSPSHPCVGRPRKQKYPDGDTPERLNGRLHIIDIRKQRSCVVCNYTGKKSRPIYFFKTCPEKPQLCLNGCFERYHTVYDYTS